MEPCALPQIPPVGDPKMPNSFFHLHAIFGNFCLSACLNPKLSSPITEIPWKSPVAVLLQQVTCMSAVHVYWCCISTAGAASSQLVCSWCRCCISVAGAASLQLVQHLCNRCCITTASDASLQLVLHLCSWCCISAAGAASLQLVLHHCS